MGMTGAGKSTFISLCTQDRAAVAGHGLLSCTSRVTVHTMTYCNRTIHLIDTPGFDDSGRTDGETLQELAFWLAAAYERNIYISGLIYLHRITDTRLQGSAFRALTAFKKLCGPENYCGIVLATTRWDELTPDQMSLASGRQRELCKKESFWGDIHQGGGKVVALSAARIDAMNIIKHIVSKDRRLTLAFQRQLIDEERPIHKTDAGQLLYDASTEDFRQMQDQLSIAEQDFRNIIDTEHSERREELSNFMSNLSQNMKPFENDLARLKMTAKDLKAVWEENLRKDLEDIRRASEINEERLKSRLNQFQSLPNSGYSDTASVTGMSDEVRQLERERDDLFIIKKQKLAGRHSTTTTTTMSVVGTGLAVGQLVAALACTVM
ncbi:hypothetical protein K469DRAFT_612569 [Zopfia rhizophila CBS 207.26]|uniref:G domain-containing protein n=1 Tax=Zopfia rhizophila CBS 207.26 TaxID=1314779 RepID=A0A6A6D798_9PEZI|nr:hypothetical protein K469DRAFT_612569 [Zopfia rhizophila CBS 207.26]